MLRMIIRRRYKDHWNGLEMEDFETVDIDIPKLEQILTGGGTSENGYDIRELAGVEVLPPNVKVQARTEAHVTPPIS